MLDCACVLCIAQQVILNCNCNCKPYDYMFTQPTHTSPRKSCVCVCLNQNNVKVVGSENEMLLKLHFAAAVYIVCVRI